MKRIWIALGVLLFFAVIAGIYVLGGKMGVTFTEPAG